jgi:hypothetical protein
MDPLPGSAQYNVSINATANSTLPPFINAVEIYSIVSAGVGTYSEDGTRTVYTYMRISNTDEFVSAYIYAWVLMET